MQDPRGIGEDQWREIMAEWGEPAYRARQVWEALQRQERSYDEMTNLPRDLRRRLAEHFPQAQPRVREERQGADGSRKLLLELADGEGVEAVLLPRPWGYAGCISTQAGCRMGCAFCASTLGGRRRQLTAGEMLAQVQALGRLTPRGELSRVLLMGSGEPLDNLAEVERFLELIHAPGGLEVGRRRTVLSTCGLVPELRRLARRGLPLTLSVSLHAPADDLRAQLMPVAGRYPLAELLDACREWQERTGRMVTMEYVLLEGINDAPSQARDLARLLAGRRHKVNLIPYNRVPERPFRATRGPRREAFARLLAEGGIPVTVRRSLGREVEAACGQLRRRRDADGGALQRGQRRGPTAGEQRG